jgi:hypothetical protein
MSPGEAMKTRFLFLFGGRPVIKTRRAIRTAMAAALLCFAACGKKEEGTSTPILAPPNAVENVPAQAEVKASSGPIELSFLLHKTQIKAGEYLWQQIRIRNVGDKKILIGDFVFYDPRELRKQTDSSYFIYLEAVGPDGKPLRVEFQQPAEQGRDIAEEVSGLLEVEGPQEKAMRDSWKKQGLSEREIGSKLIDFNMKKQRSAPRTDQWSGIELLPGQSVETKSAFFYSLHDKIKKKPVPRTIGDYAQLDFFLFEKPGDYKLRAVYNHAPSPGAKKRITISPEDVLVRTPWIQVTVTP